MTQHNINKNNYNKMKKVLLTICSILCTGMLLAEETVKPWKFSGVVGLNASATGMVNWAAGGNNNVNGVAFGKLRLMYDKENLSWETNLDLEYGLTFVDQKYDKLQKSSDHIVFNTKFGWAFAPKWFLTAQAGFQSQFTPGYTYNGDETANPIISNWLAPSYTDISVGIDWKPNSIFSVYLSPVAGRITTAWVSDKTNQRYNDIYPLEDGGLRDVLQNKYATWKYVNDPAVADAFVREYSNAKAELGLSFKGGINWAYKDLKIITNLTLFTPYKWDKVALYRPIDPNAPDAATVYSANAEGREFIGYRDNNRRFGNFDVDWDVAISYQFLKCLNVTLSTSMKYYNGVMIADKEGNSAERVQFKSILGLGVGYSF